LISSPADRGGTSSKTEFDVHYSRKEEAMSDDPGEPGGAADEPLTGMFQRIFSDPEFASALERDPEQALREVGFDLDEQAIDELNRIRAEEPQPEMVGARALPAVAIAVRVYTSPAIRAGTSPAVRVVTQTQVPIRQQQEFAERIKKAEEEATGEDDS
jgi:hypothetical protein